MVQKEPARLWRYRNVVILLVVGMVVAGMLMSCEQPYDMTSVLGGKTLIYSKGPDFKETYVFASDGKSGTFASESFTYKYPDAASEGDYTKKAWVKTGGWKATFTYDEKTHDLVYSFTHQYSLIPGLSTSYAADYTEYTVLDYQKAKDSEASAVTRTRTKKLLFNQDKVESVYVLGAANGWIYTDSYAQSITIGASTYAYSTVWTEKYTLTATSVVYSGVFDSEDKTDGAITNTTHDTTDKTYSVYAVYRLGDTDEGEAFADMWKEDGLVTFRANQTNETYKEWEGDTPPAAPTVNASTGTGATGTRDADPLSYYYIDNNTYGQTSFTFHHYGDFMTWFSSSANRGLEP